MKTKVLLVIGGLNMGGAETFLMNILRNIDREKFEFYFLCYGNKKFDYEEEVYQLGANIIRIENINKKNFFKYIGILENIIKKYNIDIVHAHTYYNSMFAVYAAHKCGVKKIITHSHNTFSETNPSTIKKIYFKISKFIINKYSTDFFACGQNAGEALFYKKNKFTIIDNGINLNNFFYAKKIRNEKRKELNINDKTVVIGHIGRFEKVKNHSFILDIFKEYQLINKNSKLILIGDGILKDDIMKKSKKLKIIDNVLFLGKRHDVNELYNAMDLILFPSLFEGLPVTLIEAQANGLPILASDTIDEDVNISKKIVFKSLNDSAKNWAIQTERLINKRYDCNEIMINSKYNMRENICKLEEIYINGKKNN